MGSGGVCCLVVELCPAFLFRLCVCCHSIVGLVVSLCGRVVSLWNGGGGCAASTVCTSFML